MQQQTVINGALEISKYSLSNLLVHVKTILHELTYLVYTIVDFRPCDSNIMQCINDTSIQGCILKMITHFSRQES